MDLTKADTLTVEVRVKGADKLSIVMKSFKEVAIKTKRSMKIIKPKTNFAKAINL